MTFDTRTYWQKRYKARRKGSGAGSRGEMVVWKADRINHWAAGMATTLDIGSGDGHLAAMLRMPGYLGVDLAPAAVAVARKAAPGKAFRLLGRDVEPRELHLSIDVLHHLVDDGDYHAYLALLFSASRRVVVHSTDFDATGRPHVRHRHWTPDVPDGWRQVAHEDSQMALGKLTVWERR